MVCDDTHLITGAPPMEMPPVVPSMDADHPDFFIPKPVEEFLPRFRRHIRDKVFLKILSAKFPYQASSIPSSPHTECARDP